MTDDKKQQLRCLSKLKLGETGRVHSFTDPDTETNLMEMGCVPGAIIQIARIAPLGDPIAILVAGYRLAIRKKDADHVWVSD